MHLASSAYQFSSLNYPYTHIFNNWYYDIVFLSFCLQKFDYHNEWGSSWGIHHVIMELM